MVEVADVFYNLPARRKFLKSDAAEAAQLSRFVTQLALCYPEVGFTLTSSGRKVIAVPPVTSLSDRLYQLYGDRQDLVQVDREFGGLRLHGFIAALAEQGPVRGPQHVFVNRRIVKDRTIAHAILDAYSVATNKERSPEVHLFLDVPPDRVDVNVHPTKAEVRFREQSQVHQLVRHALGDALGKGPGAGADASHIGRAAGPPDAAVDSRRSAAAAASRAAGRRPIRSTEVRTRAFGTTVPTRARTCVTNRRPRTSVRTLVANLSVRPMIALGQFRDTFIIAMDDEGLCIIDQHVAHERVLFERIMERLTNESLESQRLLIPPSSNCRRPSGRRWSRKAEALARFGFEVEEFGGDSIKVTAMPALLRSERVRRGAARAGGRSRGPRSRAAHRGCAQADRGDDGVPCGGEGALSADAREDAPHPRGAARHRVFDRVPARPAGDAAHHAARDREELRPHLGGSASLDDLCPHDWRDDDQKSKAGWGISNKIRAAPPPLGGHLANGGAARRGTSECSHHLDGGRSLRMAAGPESARTSCRWTPRSHIGRLVRGLDLRPGSESLSEHVV